MRRARALALVLVLVPLAGCFLFGRRGAQCPTDRTIVLATQEDVADFAGCQRAVGLAIRTGATIDVAPLHDLVDITGDLTIGQTVGVDALTIDVRRVGGAVRATGNASLRGLFLPLLEHAGRVEVDANTLLGTVSLPRLADVTESIVITDNSALALIDMPSLVSVGNELVIAGQPKLERVGAAHLRRAGAVRVEADPKLTSDTIDKLRAAAQP
jgi:hypothetical protein